MTESNPEATAFFNRKDGIILTLFYDMIYLLDKLADILIKNFNINVGSVIGKKIVSASNIFLATQQIFVPAKKLQTH